MISCDCNAALSVLGELKCANKENLGQIQKLLFVPVHYTGADGKTYLNGLVTATGDTKSVDLDTVKAMFAATGNKKGVITPYVEAPSQEGGDPITFGGGNDTVGGAEEIVGTNASTISFVLRRWAQSMIKKLKSFSCVADLGVYFIGENEQIEGKAGMVDVEDDGTVTPTAGVLPFPVRSFFVGDKVHGGLQEPDSNALQFALLPNYSDDLVIVNTPGILSVVQDE